MQFKCQNSSISSNSIKSISTVYMSNTSIRHIARTPSGATTLGQSGPRNDGNKEVLCISQSSSITKGSPSDFLVS